MLIFASYWKCGLIINKRPDKVNPLKHLFLCLIKNIYHLYKIDAYSGDAFLY